jgi:ketosteroid isomerase-like protein
MHISLVSLVVSAALLLATSQQAPAPSSLKAEIDALNASMTAAFTKDPASVAAFYADDALILGGGQRYHGRAAINGYWSGATMFTGWTLETIEVGGPANAPWYYGRSVLTSSRGTSPTHYIALLRRDASGALKFKADLFVRDRAESGADEAGKVNDAWLSATQRGDAKALGQIFDDAFVIMSSNARTKAQEIADLVPQPGVSIPYFKSEETVTRAFGPIAVTSGILKWEYNGRPFERNYSSISKSTPSGWKIFAQQVTPR